MNRRNTLKSLLTLPLIPATSLVGKEKFPTKIEVKGEDLHKYHIYCIDEDGNEKDLKELIGYPFDIDRVIVDRKTNMIKVFLSGDWSVLSFLRLHGVGWRRNRVIYSSDKLLRHK